MTPEEKARREIDRQLEQCGWLVQDRTEMNISAGPGVAVREFPMITGEADYLLYSSGKAIGVVDNDWIECYNSNGALCARAVVSQRIPSGMVMMYHAQEKIVNTPGSEITGTRGGIHNSVTRIALKPTHMIGGYAQLSYGFNYYGTVGSNRDEFLIVRKMSKIDWLDGEETAVDPTTQYAVRAGETS